MSKTFEQMNKTELVEAIAFLKLEGKVTELAKNSDKPTNLEYVKVLEAYKEAQDKVNKDVAKKMSKDKSTASNEKFDAPVTKEVSNQNMSEDLFTTIPVIITDHDTNQSVEDDNELRTVSITWGNPVIGMYTVNVPLHGRMTYLSKGAVIRLKRMSMATATNDANGKPIVHRDLKRFSVAETTGWTPEQFEAHKTEQQLKKL